MSFALELSERIESTLKAFLESDQPFGLDFGEPIDLKRFSAELNILPLALNFSSCYAIRPNGEVVVLDFDADDVYGLIETEIEPRIRALVLCQGAKNYPELHEISPQRPEDARTCPYCDGTGIEPMNVKLGYDKERIVCWCGGLSWLPKDEDWASLFV